MKHFGDNGSQEQKCKYFDVPCSLGLLAPECDMLCELNIEAKEHFRELNRMQKERGKDHAEI